MDTVINTRELNLVDIVRLKKDLLWGKYYYGQFEKGKLIDTILYSNYQNNKNLIEIHNIELKTREFLNKFTHSYSSKKKIRYFIRELDENTEARDIEFMNSCGFKRFNRNYCYEYNPEDHSLSKNTLPSIFCREADKKDINKLLDIDISCQIIDYRDALFKTKKFFKDNLEHTYVFVDPVNTDQLYAYAFKRDVEHGSTFEFIIHCKQSNIVKECINAFAVKYIHFEKSAPSFRFIINENQKDLVEELRKDYPMLWSAQVLILEGAPKEKVKKPTQNLALNKARAGGA